MSADISPKQALRRYLKLFIPSMVAYVGLLTLVTYVLKAEVVSGPAIYAVAILPGLAALVFLYAYFRFINETDEVARRVQLEATLVAVAAILAFTLTWGLLELIVDTMVRIPMFYIFPAYFLVQGLAAWRFNRKYGAGGCLP